jgi:hypothetical protein
MRKDMLRECLMEIKKDYQRELLKGQEKEFLWDIHWDFQRAIAKERWKV